MPSEPTPPSNPEPASRKPQAASPIPYASSLKPQASSLAFIFTNLDRLLLIGWALASILFLAIVGREVAYHATSIRWNTMWESAPLEVAYDAAQGRPIYGNWHEGPVHLAIYGPLFYETLGTIGALLHADHVAMIQIGRWTGITFLALGLFGVCWFVKSQRLPWWAMFAALSCAGLLTPTALRFVASARPDTMAAALAVLGLTAAVNGRRWGLILGAILLSAAWLTKVTAIAAPAAALFALLVFPNRPTTSAWATSNPGGRASRPPSGSPLDSPAPEALPTAQSRYRRPLLFCLLMLLINGTAVAALTLSTHGWFERHLHIASSAPMGYEYAWYMLTRRRRETAIPYLFIFPLLAMLATALLRTWQKEDATRHGQAPPPRSAPAQAVCIASVFFLISALVALLTAMRQGADRNYLIEPTLAAGMLLGACAARMAAARSPREWLATRAAAVFALFSPMLMEIPTTRWYECDPNSAQLRDSMQPYQDNTLAWARSLPQPLVSLDSWLTFRAGVTNDLSDPIAYNSYCRAGGQDPVADRVRRKYYAAVVTLAAADGQDFMIYSDIGTFWPALLDALKENYELQEQHGMWYVYVPRK